jgi:IS66 Orf2 like protein
LASPQNCQIDRETKRGHRGECAVAGKARIFVDADGEDVKRAAIIEKAVAVMSNCLPKGANLAANGEQVSIRGEAIGQVRIAIGDRVKLLFWDQTGFCLLSKRLEDGKFRWPKVQDSVMRLSLAQLSALLE